MKKRILVLLAVVALMVVMLAMAVAPAFAVGGPGSSCAAWFGSDGRAPYCPAVYRPGAP